MTSDEYVVQELMNERAKNSELKSKFKDVSYRYEKLVEKLKENLSPSVYHYERSPGKEIVYLSFSSIDCVEDDFCYFVDLFEIDDKVDAVLDSLNGKSEVVA